MEHNELSVQFFNTPPGNPSPGIPDFQNRSEGFGGHFENDFGGTVTPQGFGFTITGGQVSAMDLVSGTLTFSLNLPANATFSVDASANTITETLAGTSTMETILYSAEPTSTNLYQISQETTTITNPTTTTASGFTKGYAFTITNGQVTAMQEVFNNLNFSATENQQISPTTVFTVNGTTVTETSIHGNTIETTSFTQPSGSSLYAVASESSTMVLPGTATTLLSINPNDRAEFTIGTGGNVTQVQAVSTNGVVTTITPPSNVTFSQIDPGFVQETTTVGSNSYYTVFYQGSTATPYAEIAHGVGTTVDLVGVKAQLAEIPASLLSLI
jgi:hypothetical protein